MLDLILSVIRTKIVDTILTGKSAHHPLIHLLFVYDTVVMNVVDNNLLACLLRERIAYCAALRYGHANLLK